MPHEYVMPPIINPLTGRKVRTECNTYKKVASKLCQNPNLLYETCNTHDPYVFALNFVYLESTYGLPQYDPNLTHILFYPNGTWKHMHIQHIGGTIPILDPITSSLYTASALPPSPNECFMSTLDTLDDWDQLDRWRIIATEDGYMFDLFFILKSIINELNEVKNGNAYPIYPTNPFTKQPLSGSFFKTMRKKLIENQIRPAAVLTVFFRDWTPKESPIAWIEQFEAAGLRFYKELEGTGYWDFDNHPMSRLIQEAFFGTELDHLLFIIHDRPFQYYWHGGPTDPANERMIAHGIYGSENDIDVREVPLDEIYSEWQRAIISYTF